MVEIIPPALRVEIEQQKDAHIADLERQIAELRASYDKLLVSWAESRGRHFVAEAENARLRALSLKDEVERILEPFVRFIEHHDGPRGMKAASATAKADDFVILRLSPGYPPVTLGHLRAAQSLLSRLRAGEQEGWRSMDSAPKDGTPILAIGFYSEKWGDIEEYIYEGEPNFWHCRKRGVCIRPDYAWRYRWMSTFDLPPFPAAPSEQGGDRD